MNRVDLAEIVVWNECNRRKTTGMAGLIQKSELNGLVLEVVEERRKSETSGAEIDGGSGKGEPR